MTLSELAAQWRVQADDMDRSAKSYNRSCVKEKGMQLILLAKQLRGCAAEIEKHAVEMARSPMAEMVQDGALASTEGKTASG